MRRLQPDGVQIQHRASARTKFSSMKYTDASSLPALMMNSQVREAANVIPIWIEYPEFS